MCCTSKKDLILNIFKKCPSARRYFIKKSMRCPACELNRFATVEECCRNHKVKDIDNFVRELNKFSEAAV